MVYWFENTKILTFPINILVFELIFAFTAGMIFFYLIENPLMNLGNLIISFLSEQSDDNISFVFTLFSFPCLKCLTL